MSWHATELSISAALLGIGMAVGAAFGPAAASGGLVLILGGLVVFLLRPRRATVIAGVQYPQATGGEAPTDLRPAMLDLGTRVEGILRLAEQQADEHRSEARREAQQIVARARAEAAAIRAGTPLPTDPTAPGSPGSSPTVP